MHLLLLAVKTLSSLCSAQRPFLTHNQTKIKTSNSRAAGVARGGVGGRLRRRRRPPARRRRAGQHQVHRRDRGGRVNALVRLARARRRLSRCVAGLFLFVCCAQYATQRGRRARMNKARPGEREERVRQKPSVVMITANQKQKSTSSVRPSPSWPPSTTSSLLPPSSFLLLRCNTFSFTRARRRPCAGCSPGSAAPGTPAPCTPSRPAAPPQR